MTRSRYFLAKLLSAFGIAPLDRYRTAAAFEAHLLRDSAIIMGELAWPGLEEVDEISSEYWQLRKLSKARREIAAKLETLDQKLEEAHDARIQAVEEVAEVTKDKVDARNKTSEDLDRLLKERDEIQKEGRSLKRVHSGLRTKLEVLNEEFDEKDHPSIIATREELKAKRIKFEKIKERREVVDQQITKLQGEFSELSEVIEKENNSIRENAEAQFGTIGKTNKQVTDLRNQLGVIDTEREELCSEVGKFILDNSKDPTIRAAAQDQRGLLSLIEEVRASSYRHHRIIGN